MRRAALDPCTAPLVKTKQQRFCKTKSVWFTAERQQLLSNLQMHLLSTEHKWKAIDFRATCQDLGWGFVFFQALLQGFNHHDPQVEWPLEHWDLQLPPCWRRDGTQGCELPWSLQVLLFITARISCLLHPGLPWHGGAPRLNIWPFCSGDWHKGGGTAGDAPCTGNVGSHQKGHIPYSHSSTISWTQIFNAYPSPIFIKSHLLSACSGSKLSHLHGRIDAIQYWDDTFNLRLRWLFGLIS